MDVRMKLHIPLGYTICELQSIHSGCRILQLEIGIRRQEICHNILVLFPEEGACRIDEQPAWLDKSGTVRE